MLNEQTIAKLNAMKLFGMAKGFAETLGAAHNAELSHEEFFGLLVDDEKNYRDNAKLQRLLTKAKLRQQGVLEDVDFRHPRGLDKQTIVEISRGNWLSHHQNVLITGPTGVGQGAVRPVRTSASRSDCGCDVSANSGDLKGIRK